ncbi:MAG: hypothetical protein WC759_00955 [Candidatus Micrarchaeia archaeon]|jgi:hypothetical protein
MFSFAGTKAKASPPAKVTPAQQVSLGIPGTMLTCHHPLAETISDSGQVELQKKFSLLLLHRTIIQAPKDIPEAVRMFDYLLRNAHHKTFRHNKKKAKDGPELLDCAYSVLLAVAFRNNLPEKIILHQQSEQHFTKDVSVQALKAVALAAENDNQNAQQTATALLLHLAKLGQLTKKAARTLRKLEKLFGSLDGLPAH